MRRFDVWWHVTLAIVFAWFCAERSYQHSWGWLAFDVVFLLLNTCEATKRYLNHRDERRMRQWQDFLGGWMSAG